MIRTLRLLFIILAEETDGIPKWNIEQMPDTIKIILTLVIVAVTAGLAFLIYRSVVKEFKKWRDESNVLVEGLITKTALVSIITSHISRFGQEMPFPLMYADLDGFTQFVQTFGEKESQKTLERIANQILSVLPSSARVSNYQGDKFLIFVNSAGSDRSQILDMATKVREAINRPIKLYDSDEIRPQGSVAIAFYPMHGTTVAKLEDSLKITMYNIKKSGGNAIRIYSDNLRTEGENIEYYYQIKRAIHNKEFQLYYQAMVDTATNKLFGFETLVRWHHPELGVLTPDKFLTIMDQTGDIDYIGKWGLNELLKAYDQLKQDFPDLNLLFTMNLSHKQLISQSLSQEYQKIIKTHKIEVSSIAFEVPEFALFDKKEGLANNITNFRNLGFIISVDGMELDYSVLSKEEAKQIGMIKFNKELMKDEDSYMKKHLVELILEFAGKSNILVTCEQVENEDMVKKAHNYGIKIMQGWYFSKPIAVEQVKDFIAGEKWKTNQIDVRKKEAMKDFDSEQSS